LSLLTSAATGDEFHPAAAGVLEAVLDERRPGAFETFARQFLRRVNAEFVASPPEIKPDAFRTWLNAIVYLAGQGDVAGGVVGHVGRAFGEEAVALRVGVGAEAEIVAGAWDFERINRRYTRHLKILAERPGGPLCNLKSAISNPAKRGGR
jgi:hypothetical protein